VLALLQSVAERKQATPGQVALAWLLARRPQIVPIPEVPAAERGRLVDPPGQEPFAQWTERHEAGVAVLIPKVATQGSANQRRLLTVPPNKDLLRIIDARVAGRIGSMLEVWPATPSRRCPRCRGPVERTR
jgi:hypothetical protein